MILGFITLKKIVKPHHVISVVVFFVKFWSNVLSLLPMPKFASYRQMLTFQYVPEMPILQMT